MATDQDDAEGAIAVTSEQVFFAATRRLDLVLRLQRLTLGNGAVGTLAEGVWEEIQEISASGTRVYVIGDQTLWSVPFAGGEVRWEGIDADSITTQGALIVSADYRNLYLRRGDVGPYELVAELEGEVLVKANPDKVVVAVNDVTVATPAYRILELEPGFAEGEASLEPLFTGLGKVRALALADRTVYYAIQSETTEGSVTIYRIPNLGTAELVTEVTDFTGMAVSSFTFLFGEDALFTTFARDRRYGIRLLSLAQPRYERVWQTAGPLTLLAHFEPHLWFFDTFEVALVRADPQLLVSPDLPF